MFDDVLIESAGKDRKKGGWVTALISGVLHIGIIGAVVAAGYYVKQNPEVVQKPNVAAPFVITRFTAASRFAFLKPSIACTGYQCISKARVSKGCNHE